MPTMSSAGIFTLQIRLTGLQNAVDYLIDCERDGSQSGSLLGGLRYRMVA